ncbi:transposase, partial [Dysgonomonas termitidis]
RDIAASEVIISEIDDKVRQALSPYDNVIELLKGVPGFNLKTAQDLIAEIGLDMSVFPSEKHLCSWVGISPGNNESAGKKKADEPPTEINPPKRQL